MATIETQGTTIGRGDGSSPESYTTIPQVTNMNPVGQNRDLIDVTNLSSTAREYKLAIKDGQEIQLEIQYDPSDTEHSGLRTDMNDGTTRSFQITDSDSPSNTITFNALVTNWSLGYPIDSVVPLNVTLKPTGDLTFA